MDLLRKQRQEEARLRSGSAGARSSGRMRRLRPHPGGPLNGSR
jgi:hypothetical protein